MTAPSDTLAASPAAPSAASPTRPFFWSVRRELWESHSIVIAPLVVAAVMLFGFTVSAFSGAHMTSVHRTTSVTQQVGGAVVQNGAHVTVALTPEQKAGLVALPYEIAAMALIVTLFIVAIFYCLGALHNERRDRTILFWKSLPVPDLTTVLSKAIVPLAIMPLVTFVVIVATQAIMLSLNAAALAAHGKSVGDLLANVPLGSMTLVLAYGLVTLALWWAPIYGWLLLVSGWAKRAPFLWAVLPPLLLALAEKVAFNSNHVASQIFYRLVGSYEAAFVVPTRAMVKAGAMFPTRTPQLDPVKFLSTPDLWIGLVVAAGFIAAAVWSRRYREPI